ncbi:MAG TPA: DNA topoisomerase IB [Terrimesophilobacter sp.]|nr:DNA topoisomerase IB [Terrimesophilobacter sp.]
MSRLRRSNPSAPGYRRRASGTGFSYLDLDGATVRDPELRARFQQLAIPPAWSDVWICQYPSGHIQATGLDAAGRRQYLYHPQWREARDRVKFDRTLELAATLPAARAQVTRALRDAGDPQARALAAAFRMLDTGSLRIGSERYTDANGSHGLSTLLCSHVSVSRDTVALCFPAKGGQLWQSEILDPDLALFVRACLRRRGDDEPLLAWDADHSLSAADINTYVRERTGGDFTAKDFRTLHGTVAAALSLAETGAHTASRAQSKAIAAASAQAATVLGNTPAIARKSYIDPRLIDRYTAGETISLGGAPEPALRALILG